MHKNYWEHDESEPEDETRFACPCGDERCVGFSDDPDNINVCGTFYANGCQMGRTQKLIAEGKGLEQAAKADVARDDFFDQVRR